MVLIGNIISNIATMVMSGYGFFDVFRRKLKAARDLRDYLNKKRELSDLEFLNRINQATVSQQNTIEVLKQSIINNPIHPLMEAGMYQSIIEDMKESDRTTGGRVGKILKNKINKPMPSWFVTFVKNLYMVEGTPFFDFMHMTTQYSDFVARVANYDLIMEDAPKAKNFKYESAFKKAHENYERNARYQVLSTYVNYSKPSSKLEQYMNDMGLIIFTKFFKRTQSVIKRMLTDKPLTSAIFLAGQFLVMDTEDITEQHWLVKNYGAMIKSPMEIYMDAFMPTAVEVVLDSI